MLTSAIRVPTKRILSVLLIALLAFLAFDNTSLSDFKQSSSACVWEQNPQEQELEELRAGGQGEVDDENRTLGPFASFFSLPALTPVPHPGSLVPIRPHYLLTCSPRFRRAPPTA